MNESMFCGVPWSVILELSHQMDKADLDYTVESLKSVFAEEKGPDSLLYMLRDRNRRISELEDQVERIKLIVGGG